MKRLLILIFAFVFCNITPLIAQQYYVGPSGSDTNDCLTYATACKTPQHIVSIMPTGVGPVDLNLLDGNYTFNVDLPHYRYLRIVGNCSVQSNVQITVPAGTVGFFVEDHATLHTRCLRVQTNGNGSTAFGGRQYAIIDFDLIEFGYFPLGTYFSLNETSRANCVGTNWLVSTSGGAGAQNFSQTRDHSTITMSCALIASQPTSFQNASNGIATPFHHGTKWSIGDYSGFTYYGTITGQKYFLQNSEIDGASLLPGSGTTADSLSAIH